MTIVFEISDRFAVTFADAADALGCTPDTLRNAVKREKGLKNHTWLARRPEFPERPSSPRVARVITLEGLKMAAVCVRPPRLMSSRLISEARLTQILREGEALERQRHSYILFMESAVSLTELAFKTGFSESCLAAIAERYKVTLLPGYYRLTPTLYVNRDRFNYAYQNSLLLHPKLFTGDDATHRAKLKDNR